MKKSRITLILLATLLVAYVSAETIDYDNISFENISQELALSALIQAEKDMEEMQQAGFGIMWINDTSIEAKKYFEGADYTILIEELEGINDSTLKEQAKSLLIEAQDEIGVLVDYEKVLEKTRAISKRKTEAYEIVDLIKASEIKINEFEAAGFDASILKDMLEGAKIEFEEERYENAIELLAAIEPKIEEIKTETTYLRTIYRLGRQNLITFIKDHYIAIIITLLISTAIFLLSYNRVVVIILKRKIKDMEIENDIITNLIKKAQKDYYTGKVISKQTYDIKLKNYKERASEIKEKLPVVKARLDKISKMKRII